jgi:hypothetical protein
MYQFTITTLVVGVLFFSGYNLLVIVRKTNFFLMSNHCSSVLWTFFLLHNQNYAIDVQVVQITIIVFEFNSIKYESISIHLIQGACNVIQYFHLIGT